MQVPVAKTVDNRLLSVHIVQLVAKYPVQVVQLLAHFCTIIITSLIPKLTPALL